MNYIRKALILGSLIAFSPSQSAEETTTNDLYKQTQFLEARLPEVNFNQFITLPENHGILQMLSVVSYGDYEQALYNYYHSPLHGNFPIRTPESFKRCKNRSTEQWRPDVDKVNDYVGHISYIMKKNKGG